MPIPEKRILDIGIGSSSMSILNILPRHIRFVIASPDGIAHVDLKKAEVEAIAAFLVTALKEPADARR